MIGETEELNDALDNSSEAILSPSNSDISDVLHEVSAVNGDLMPEPLIFVPVTLNKVSSRALLDTGSSISLIREDIVPSIGSSIQECEKYLIGVGGKKVQCLGQITVSVLLHGIVLRDLTLYVVAKTDMLHNVIFGTDCFMNNSIVVDIPHLKLSGTYEDGTVWDYYLGRDSESCKVVFRQIPVIASERVVVDNLEVKEVPVNISAYYSSFQGTCDLCQEREVPELFYDGELDPQVSLYTIGYAGLCDFDLKSVLVSKHGNSSRKDVIKPGDHLGYLNSVVCLDLPVNEVNLTTEQEGAWTEDKLRETVSLSGDLTVDQSQAVIKMLSKQSNVISVGNSDVGRAAVTSHRIELYDTTPIRQKPRQFPEPVSKAIEVECQKLLDLNIIEHSRSPWASPVVPVKKKDGTLRLCIDYRQLNKVTKPDRFPIPSLRDYIFSLYKKQYFTSLDLTSGFHQIPLHPDSREYTAFSTQKGHYQYKRLSFGL